MARDPYDPSQNPGIIAEDDGTVEGFCPEHPAFTFHYTGATAKSRAKKAMRDHVAAEHGAA